MTTWAESDVCCPFYKSDDGKLSITCEGCTDGCITRTLFQRHDQQRKHLRGYCCREYKKCPIYAMLMKKYENK